MFNFKKPIVFFLHALLTQLTLGMMLLAAGQASIIIGSQLSMIAGMRSFI